jgi:hypothetical protein
MKAMNKVEEASLITTHQPPCGDRSCNTAKMLPKLHMKKVHKTNHLLKKLKKSVRNIPSTHTTAFVVYLFQSYLGLDGSRNCSNRDKKKTAEQGARNKVSWSSCARRHSP